MFTPLFQPNLRCGAQLTDEVIPEILAENNFGAAPASEVAMVISTAQPTLQPVRDFHPNIVTIHAGIHPVLKNARVVTGVPKELVRKSRRSGPRNTSCPPVPAWTPEFDETNYRTALSELAASSEETRSIYVRLPFRASGCAYCGRNATVTAKPEVGRACPDRPAREIGLIVLLPGKRRIVAQMHWGDGTPNFPSVEELTRLVRLLEEMFDFHPEAERSIEIDPRIASRSQVEAIRNPGFNRVSLGVPEFDPDIQKAIGRFSRTV